LIHRDDIWKAVTVVAAVISAIAAHSITLPPAWEPAMPYIEFVSAITAVVMAVLIKPQGGTS
jgi:branched-subunit amino acid transport protein